MREIATELVSLRAPVERIQRRLGGPHDDDAMTVGAVAVLVRKTAEWVQSATQLNNTGHFDPRARRYVISKNKLRHFLISKYGAAPA